MASTFFTPKTPYDYQASPASAWLFITTDNLAYFVTDYTSTVGTAMQRGHLYREISL
ncbi:hypothetical protein CKA32_002537 [Geitlerinema sp. FC II]|nr:hypothetical protein CKA32_002537 [Geitlerinema sp. FC II]